MMLDDLLGPVPRAKFLDEYYLKRPFSRPGGCQHLAAAAGWPLIETLLRQPGADFLAARQGQVWPGPGVPTADQARQLMADGHTLRFRQAQCHDAALAELAEGFRRAFAGPVDVQVFCTPAGHPGFGWHYDAEEVFVLQAQGRKTWWLRKNTVNPWPLVETLPQDMRFEREIMPALACDLHAGDWLYIPAGYWHRTQAGDEESISLSVGVQAPAALDLYDFLRPRLRDALEWRQRLQTPGDAVTLTEDELIRRYQELFAELGRDLAERLVRPETIRAFLKQIRAGGAGAGPDGGTIGK